MKRKNIWATAAIALSLCTVLAAYLGVHSRRTAASQEQLVQTANAFLDCVHTADTEQMAQMLTGSPNLGQRPDAELAEGMIWDAFFTSLKFEIPDTSYASQGDVAMDIAVTCLDVESLMSTLEKKLPTALSVAARKAGEEPDEKGNYRAEFTQSILAQTVCEALPDCPGTQKSLTLHFAREAGDWKILPTPELLQLLGCYAS